MQKIGKMLSFRWKDLGITVFIMALTSGLCWLLKPVSENDAHVPQIFLVSVMLISLWTKGYLFGILASVIAVLGVNIVFTYPYFQMDFSLTGYPLTFLCMLAASLFTCTVTTRLVESEEIKRQAEQERVRANLLRAISHDFRTPLTGMIGSLSLLEEQDESLTHEEKSRMISDVKSEAGWLINMVENLLSITRIGGENTLLHTEPQMPEEITAEAVARFHRQYPDFPVKIQVPEEPLFAEMDAMLIEQVLLNLLLNAVMHGKTATEARIEVSRQDDTVLLSVRDNGEGISTSQLEKLFSPDSRGDTQPKDASRGMGIGLSVCQTIINAHGGRLWAESTPGKGCCFFFTLPAANNNTELPEND